MQRGKPKGPSVNSYAMIVQEYHCTLLKRGKWINPLIQRHTEKGDGMISKAQQVALEELITVQYLGEVLPERRKINFVDDPEVLNKSVSFFIWRHFGSTSMVLAQMEGI